jgi:hypothetical protein
MGISRSYANFIRTGIAWPSDKTLKFANPSGGATSSAFQGTNKPINWQDPIWMLPDALVNEPFIVW